MAKIASVATDSLHLFDLFVSQKVPVEKYPETPINECETDDNCSNATHKCCDTDTHGIRKCVAPLENQ